MRVTRVLTRLLEPCSDSDRNVACSRRALVRVRMPRACTPCAHSSTHRTHASEACMRCNFMSLPDTCATGRCSRLLLQAVLCIQDVRVAPCDCSMCTSQPDARVVPHSAVLASETSAWLVCVQRARRVALGGKRKRLSVRAVCASQHAPPVCLLSLPS